MKRVLLAASAALLVGSLSTPASAQIVNTDTYVEIIAPITVAYQRAVQFGTIAPSTSGAVTVQLGSAADDTSTAVTVGTGASIIAASTQNNGRFTLTAANGLAYNVSVAVTPLEDPGGNNDLTFTAALSATTGTGNGAAQTFYIGGDLAIPANHPPAVYTGDYTITATYQ